MNEPEGLALLDYLVRGRGLTEETIQRFRLGAVIDPADCDADARGRISIPYIKPTGIVLIRFRQAPGLEYGPKYWQPEGSKVGIYNTPVILTGGQRILISEGEFDTMIPAQLGLPGVGIPGVSNWKPWFKPIFDGYEEVIILGDNDEKDAPEVEPGEEIKLRPGEKFTKKLSSLIENSRIVMMPRGHDVNSAYLELGADYLLDRIGFGRDLA